MQFRSVFAVSLSLFSIHPLFTAAQSAGPAADKSPHHLVLFVQEPHQGAILGATTASL